MEIPKYSFWVQYSEEDECYLAFIFELPSITAHGDTPEEALREVQIALQGALEIAEEEGVTLPKPEVMSDWHGRPKFLKDKWNSAKRENKVAMISGHLDLTSDEYDEHYSQKIYDAAMSGHSFVVGDARGTDCFAITQLKLIARHREEFKWNRLTIYHMYDSPRALMYSGNFVGGFQSDEERDSAMTAASDYDIAWVRPGRENSGTARNIKRRLEKDNDKK